MGLICRSEGNPSRRRKLQIQIKTALMTIPQCSIPYRIVRRAGKQGTRPSVTGQAEVEKCATGSDGLSPFSTTSGTRTLNMAANKSNSRNNNSKNNINNNSNNNKNSRKSSNNIQFNNIRIVTINVRTAQDDIKLATIVKSASDLGIDILAMQEVRRTYYGVLTFEDESLKGWQFIWSGHKRKREHGVGILLAPHVKLENHQEHLPARIISATICVKGMKLTALNVYAPTETTKSDATKSAFYSALSKAKTYLEGTPKYKPVTLGDFNATISSQSKE